MQFAAFLRAINVGGRNIKMGELKALFEACGCRSVCTLIASGNVVFEADASPEELEAMVEGAIPKATGWSSDTCVRSRDALAEALGHGFDAHTRAEAATVSIGFLKTAPSPEAVERLMALASAQDRFLLRGREVHWWSAVKQSDSKFTNVQLEKVLGVRATLRALPTAERVLALMDAPTTGEP